MSFEHASLGRTPTLRGIAQAVLTGLIVMSATAAGSAIGDCGLPLSSSTTRTSDCLFVLRAAVGSEQCALCTCDVDGSTEVAASDALLCLRFAVGQDVVLSCPPCVDCPELVEWTTHAGIGESCATDDDCPVGGCDTGIGRCRTASELDLGWKGRAHGVDENGGSVLRAFVECGGDGQTCGSCEIEGVDPSTGNCRCANDTRVTCDTPYLENAACPACSGGAFAGMACSENAQCEGGQCAKFCAFDPEIACTTNTDCPTGRRRCEDEPNCGNGTGTTCAVNSDCAGTCTASAVCECFEAPPRPVASVEFPFCIVPRLAADLSGTVHVESGASVVVKDLQLQAYGGESLSAPCPLCGGTCSGNQQPCASSEDCAGGETCTLDPVAGDGIRAGACVGGAHDGLSCDVGATNVSFPPGGGGYSLDCMPDPADNFTGAGLRGRAVETTGASSLPAGLECDPGSSMCPCLVCSGGGGVACSSDEECSSLQSCSGLPEQGCDTNTDCENFDLGTCTAVADTRCTGSLSTPCTTNADCVAVDFGPCMTATCSTTGEGIEPQPNDCVSKICTDDGNGEGTCGAGPEDMFCDGLLTAEGIGIRRCLTNQDCGVEMLGFDAGDCTLVQGRACFLDPITAEGVADPVQPLAVATFCASPTTSVGANESLGLPGPVRLRRQTTLEFLQRDLAP